MALAVVTSLFNCTANSIRHQHYLTFKEKLCKDLPLYTVELAFDDFPFVLNSSEENILQIRCSTWMWQRDKIINTMLQHIPSKYDNIALIDADIIFHDPNWHKDTEGMLRECKVGQLWANCHHTKEGIPPDRGISNRDKGIVHTGYAWAGRRDFLENSGIFDRSPVGGNDVLITIAYCGWRKHPYLQNMTPIFIKYFWEWAENIFNETQGDVGYVDSDITHLWHGTKQDRNYMGRLNALANFDPATDLKTSSVGTWEWATDKPIMHKKIEDYMKGRIRG